MTNEKDDDVELEDANFDEFDEGGKTLGSMIKENPMLKIGLIAGAVIVIFGAIIVFGGSEQAPGTSMVGSGSDVSAPPGTTELNPQQIAATREVNERDREIAIMEGTSAIPTPIDPPVGILTAPEQPVDAEDPLQRWRRLQEERLQRELQETEVIQPVAVPQDTNRAQNVQALADLMSEQMQAILESNQNRISYTVVSDPAALQEQLAAQQEAVINAATLEEPAQGELVQEVLLPAGKIQYAQLLIEANTDVPGPVLAQIMSGPLKGSRIIGDFDTQREHLTLNFGTLIYQDESLDVEAVALDPGTSLPGLATEVDKRYLQRIVLPAAAAFVEGLANAISESGRTNVTIQGETVAESTNEADNDQEVASGVEEAGQEVRDIIDEEVDDIETLIRIEAGTPMGILFLEPVVRERTI